jgi:hypothetical protein
VLRTRTPERITALILENPRPNARWLIAQGEFLWQNLRSDGYVGTSPVGSFPANGYGLYDKDQERLGVDLGLVRAAARGRGREPVLHAAQPARHLTRGELFSRR